MKLVRSRLAAAVADLAAVVALVAVVVAAVVVVVVAAAAAADSAGKRTGSHVARRINLWGNPLAGGSPQLPQFSGEEYGRPRTTVF